MLAGKRENNFHATGEKVTEKDIIECIFPPDESKQEEKDSSHLLSMLATVDKAAEVQRSVIEGTEVAEENDTSIKQIELEKEASLKKILMEA